MTIEQWAEELAARLMVVHHSDRIRVIVEVLTQVVEDNAVPWDMIQQHATWETADE